MTEPLLIGVISVTGGFVGSLVTILAQIVLFKKESILRKILAKQESDDKFKLIALDKRLEVHQLAYKHCYDLTKVIHATEVVKSEVVHKARIFWIDNNLYLDNESRDAFLDCLQNVDNYKEYLEMNKESKGYDGNKIYDIVKIHKSILDTGKIIEKGIGLPHLEIKEI